MLSILLNRATPYFIIVGRESLVPMPIASESEAVLRKGRAVRYGVRRSAVYACLARRTAYVLCARHSMRVQDAHRGVDWRAAAKAFDSN